MLARFPRFLAVVVVTLGCLYHPRFTLAATGNSSDLPQNPGYYSIMVGANGKASRRSLDVLTASLRDELQDPRAQIVVMVHGFRTTLQGGTREYRDLAGRLRRAGDAFGLKLALVGVHWHSDPGPMRSWLPRALGNRITSLLGFRKAIKNPYLERVRRARQTGRTGLRPVLFRLQDEFPGVPIHAFVHSLGAEVVLAALAPEGGEDDKAGRKIEQPERVLHLNMVTLAGSDLDEDAFARPSPTPVRLALGRVRVWWVTVPEPGKADGVLELRQGAGRGDAIGNRGLKLEQEDLDLLLARGALVLDEGNIPTWHSFTDYYNDRRLKALAASLLALQQPASPAARRSTLAALDAVLKADLEALLACTRVHNASIRLYASWRLRRDAGEFDHVKIVHQRGATPGRALKLRLQNMALRLAGPEGQCPALFLASGPDNEPPVERSESPPHSSATSESGHRTPQE